LPLIVMPTQLLSLSWWRAGAALAGSPAVPGPHSASLMSEG